MARPGPLGLLLALACAVLAPAADELPRGRVIDKIDCRKTPDQGYALYLPAGYDAARRWPVLLCFDPGARGRVPVERFSAAAEKFGWVVAGSLNSRNGPWPANAAAITAMVQDLAARLALDDRRVYAAGLSGGARVACQLAAGGQLVRGVIACSAGFPGSQVPDEVPFVFFGTTGLEDFNYNELRAVDRALDGRKSPHRVVVFAGGHEWLPAPLAEEAIAWLELQAIRAGTRPRDDAFVAAQFAGRRADVPAQPVEENFRALKSLAADFKGLADTGELEKQVAALAASRAVRAALKAERALGEREDELASELFRLADDESLKAMQKEAAALRGQADAPADSPGRRMARRVIAGIGIGGRESVRALLDQREFGAAAARLELIAAVRPDRAQTFFDLARARALAGDGKRALAALQQAVALGFKDGARLAGEPAFERLRHDPKFQELAAATKP